MTLLLRIACVWVGDMENWATRLAEKSWGMDVMSEDTSLDIREKPTSPGLETVLVQTLEHEQS